MACTVDGCFSRCPYRVLNDQCLVRPSVRDVRDESTNMAMGSEKVGGWGGSGGRGVGWGGGGMSGKIRAVWYKRDMKRG